MTSKEMSADPSQMTQVATPYSTIIRPNLRMRQMLENWMMRNAVPSKTSHRFARVLMKHSVR